MATSPEAPTERGEDPREGKDAYGDTYAAGVAFFDNVFLESRRQLQFWRLQSLALLLLSALLAVALGRLALDDRVVPYVIERGPFGDLIEVGPLEDAAERDQLVGWFLARWIEDARAISSDGELQRTRWLRAYSYTSRAARPLLSDFHRSLDLRTPRNVFPHDPIRIAERSYQIRWEERSGQKREEWIAVLELETEPIRHHRASNPNPLGIYITHFQWVLQGAQGGPPS